MCVHVCACVTWIRCALFFTPPQSTHHCNQPFVLNAILAQVQPADLRIRVAQRRPERERTVVGDSIACEVQLNEAGVATPTTLDEQGGQGLAAADANVVAVIK